MSDAQLGILNYALLALLYLFFGRVLWAVWSEVSGPRRGAQQQRVATAAGPAADATGIAERPAAPAAKASRRRGVPSQLIVLQPKARKGAGYPIFNDLTIGRADSNGICLPDDVAASGVHARIRVADRQVWLEDLGSTNGTYLNGGRVADPIPLSVGDRVQVGATVFEAR